MTNANYIDSVEKHITAKFAKYVSMLVGLCGCVPPEEKSLEMYYDGGELTLSRDVFHITEGCTNALKAVLDSKIEYYTPCLNMIDNLINRTLYHGYMYSYSAAVDSETKEKIVGEGGIFQTCTHAENVHLLYKSIASMLRYNVYERFNAVTMLLYMEAVAIHRFESVCDITNISLPEMKQIISLARHGEPEKFIEYCLMNTVRLND